MTHAIGQGIRAAICASVIATASSAAEITPSEVVFEDGAVAVSLSGVAGDPVEGAVLMNKGAGNCIACHMVSALSELPFQGEIGPPLDGAADRWNQAELRGIVANAKMMFDGTMMPSFYKTEGFTRIGDAYTGKALKGEVTPLLSAQQVEDVVAFLMTLKYE